MFQVPRSECHLGHSAKLLSPRFGRVIVHWLPRLESPNSTHVNTNQLKLRLFIAFVTFLLLNDSYDG